MNKRYVIEATEIKFTLFVSGKKKINNGFS